MEAGDDLVRRRKLAPEELAASGAPFDGRQSGAGMYVFPAEITSARAWLAELERYVAAFKGPVHLIWPDADIALRSKQLAHWRKLCPQAQVTPVKTCGHFLWLEAPEAIRTFAGA
jgi:pimeloyl-ACP methyl ester carboxylesterase